MGYFLGKEIHELAEMQQEKIWTRQTTKQTGIQQLKDLPHDKIIYSAFTTYSFNDGASESRRK